MDITFLKLSLDLRFKVKQNDFYVLHSRSLSQNTFVNQQAQKSLNEKTYKYFVKNSLIFDVAAVVTISSAAAVAATAAAAIYE